MRILIVASYRSYRNSFAAFVTEQGDALAALGHEVKYFAVHGSNKSAMAYLKHLPKLRKIIKEFKPNVVHAHFGLSGLLANLQRLCPVVTTYHGSDINERKLRQLSKICISLSAWNIFVSEKTMRMVKAKNNSTLLPCGVNLDELKVIDKQKVRTELGWQNDDKYILFTSAFTNQVKDYPLAKLVIDTYNSKYKYEIKLVELIGYNREQVTKLMCAVDALLLTSKTEGSPQVVKEAMAVGCPIVSVDVGDVKERLIGVDNSYVAQTRDATELADLIHKVLQINSRTNGRERIIELGLDNKQVAEKLIEIYSQIPKPKYLK